MIEPLCVAYRDEYHEGWSRGMRDFLDDAGYSPGPHDTDRQKACALGYVDGWEEAASIVNLLPCIEKSIVE
jgi:hypothetical protein